MSGGAVVAIVVVLFFAIGVTVGVIAMIALSTVRRERGLGEPGDETAGIATGASGIPGHWEGGLADEPASWPGGTGGG
jgi:hypothetical protein